MKALLACALALVAGATTGCGADTDAAARASAQCESALHDELGLTEGDTSLDTRTEVSGDDDGRRVEGSWEHPDEGAGVFTCDVVPDDSDELRGLRVSAISFETQPQ